MNPSAEATRGSLAEQVTALVESGAVELPPLPDLAVKLQELLLEDRAGAREIAALIANEPAVVAELLKIANSALFGGLAEVKDLNTAIARLGLEQVGSIVSALLMRSHFCDGVSRKKEMLRAIWDHSVLTAFGARHLARRVAADAETAFLAGLLHDCGRLLVLKAVDQIEHGSGQAAVSAVVLDELMEKLHAGLGAAVLESWSVPPPIPQVALHHEDPVDPGEDGKEMILLCVQAADLVTQKLGFHPSPDPEIALLQEPAIENLELGDVDLATLMVDIEDELLEVRKLF